MSVSPPSREPQQISVTGEDRSQKIFQMKNVKLFCWKYFSCFLFPFRREREREKKTTIRVVYNMSKTTVSRFFFFWFFYKFFLFRGPSSQLALLSSSALPILLFLIPPIWAASAKKYKKQTLYHNSKRIETKCVDILRYEKEENKNNIEKVHSDETKKKK